MNQSSVRHEISIVTDISHHLPVVFYLFSLLSPILRYVTNMASRDTIYKLKLKIVLTHLPHSLITH